MLKSIIAAGLLLAGLAPAQAAVNLVQNGDFETVSFTNNFQFDASYAPGANGVANWSSTAGYNLLFHSAVANSSNAAGNYSYTGLEYLWASTASPTGGNFVALDGDSSVRGTMSQSITGLTTGASYLLTFNWGAAQIRSRTGATTEQIQYSLGGDTYTTNVLSNGSQQFTGWNSVSRVFTATSGTELLSFLSIGTPNGLPPVALLDSVSLSMVPENATWMTMIVGFGVVGGAIRRARRPMVARA